MLKRYKTISGKDPYSGWIPVAVFTAPHEAAQAVAQGTTGEPEWDHAPNRKGPEECLLAHWEELSDNEPKVG
jgi:hypothetical protein